MRELIEKRTPHSKLFDLGGGKRELIISREPLHHFKDGRFQDFNLEAQKNRGAWLIDGAPHALRVHDQLPSYRITGPDGKALMITLTGTSAGELRPAKPVAEDGIYRWSGVAPDLDYSLRPLPRGVTARMHLLSENAPRRFEWEFEGAEHLLMPAMGRDADGRYVELIETRENGKIVVEWTGRVTTRLQLRRNTDDKWSRDVTYPVVIDPTVNFGMAFFSDDMSTSVIKNAAGSTVGGPFQNFARDIIVAGRYQSGASGYVTWAGIRFESVAIPPGAEVSSATLTIRGRNPPASRPDGAAVHIWGDVGNFNDPFTITGQGARNITKGTESVAITVKPTVNADNNYDITDIIQEMVSAPAWATMYGLYGFGNFRLGVFPDNTGPPFSDKTGIAWEAYEFLDNDTRAARLSVTYTTGDVEASAAGVGNLSAIAEDVVLQSQVALDGIGALSVVAVDVVVQSAVTMAGTGAVSATGDVIDASFVLFSGSSNLHAEGDVISASAATLSGSSTLMADLFDRDSAAAMGGIGTIHADVDNIGVIIEEPDDLQSGRSPVPGGSGSIFAPDLPVVKKKREPRRHVIKVGDWPEEIPDNIEALATDDGMIDVNELLAQIAAGDTVDDDEAALAMILSLAA